MKLAIIESPLGTRVDGTRCTPEEFERNQRYADACMLDSLRRGEAPFGSHIIYPRVLKDALPEERKLGMSAGFAWGRAASIVNELAEDPDSEISFGDTAICATYTDLGITAGMNEGIVRHTQYGLPIEYRQLGENWESGN